MGKPSYDIKDFYWWDNIYNNASKRLNVKLDSNREEFIVVEKEKEKIQIYDGLFIKGESIIEESIKIETKEKIKTEDDLFKFCSSHKSHKQQGKLNRIQNQNEKMIDTKKFKTNQIDFKNKKYNKFVEKTLEKKKSKKRKHLD